MICLATGKLTFASPNDAERRRQRIKRKRGATSPALSVFRCAACRKWHIGHSESWQKRRKTRRVA